jgi:hypothetical protein
VNSLAIHTRSETFAFSLAYPCVFIYEDDDLQAAQIDLFISTEARKPLSIHYYRQRRTLVKFLLYLFGLSLWHSPTHTGPIGINLGNTRLF